MKESYIVHIECNTIPRLVGSSKANRMRTLSFKLPEPVTKLMDRTTIVLTLIRVIFIKILFRDFNLLFCQRVKLGTTFMAKPKFE